MNGIKNKRSDELVSGALTKQLSLTGKDGI